MLYPLLCWQKCNTKCLISIFSSLRELLDVRGGDPADPLAHPLPALSLPPLLAASQPLLAQSPAGPAPAQTRAPATDLGGHPPPDLRRQGQHPASQHHHRHRGLAPRLPRHHHPQHARAPALHKVGDY